MQNVKINLEKEFLIMLTEYAEVITRYLRDDERLVLSEDKEASRLLPQLPDTIIFGRTAETVCSHNSRVCSGSAFQTEELARPTSSFRVQGDGRHIE